MCVPVMTERLQVLVGSSSFIAETSQGDQKEREEEYLSNRKKSFSYCFL